VVVLLDVRAYLNLIKGVSYYLRKDTNLTIDNGNRYEIYNIQAKGGWIDNIIIQFNRKDVKLRIRWDGNELECTPETLWNEGRIQQNDTGLYCSQYSVADSRFVIIYNPPHKHPFSQNLIIDTRESNGNQYTIDKYWVEVLVIDNKQSLIRSLGLVRGLGHLFDTNISNIRKSHRSDR